MGERCKVRVWLGINIFIGFQFEIDFLIRCVWVRSEEKDKRWSKFESSINIYSLPESRSGMRYLDSMIDCYIVYTAMPLPRSDLSTRN
jgi:hypothetical protein